MKYQAENLCFLSFVCAEKFHFMKRKVCFQTYLTQDTNKMKYTLSPATDLFWMTSELPGCNSWKNGSCTYLVILKDFSYLGNTVYRALVNEHVSIHWVWIITTSVNVVVFYSACWGINLMHFNPAIWSPSAKVCIIANTLQ